VSPLSYTGPRAQSGPHPPVRDRLLSQCAIGNDLQQEDGVFSDLRLMCVDGTEISYKIDDQSQKMCVNVSTEYNVHTNTKKRELLASRRLKCSKRLSESRRRLSK
jgi:hypothetical protein